jgi:hypothetical protein
VRTKEHDKGSKLKEYQYNKIEKIYKEFILFFHKIYKEFMDTYLCGFL